VISLGETLLVARMMGTDLDQRRNDFIVDLLRGGIYSVDPVERELFRRRAGVGRVGQGAHAVHRVDLDHALKHPQ